LFAKQFREKQAAKLIELKVLLSSSQLLLRGRLSRLGDFNYAAPRINLPHLPRPVVEVRIPRGPGAVECKRQLLMVLVLLTPHPKGSKHSAQHSKSSSAQMNICAAA